MFYQIGSTLGPCLTVLVRRHILMSFSETVHSTVFSGVPFDIACCKFIQHQKQELNYHVVLISIEFLFCIFHISLVTRFSNMKNHPTLCKISCLTRWVRPNNGSHCRAVSPEFPLQALLSSNLLSYCYMFFSFS